MGDASVRVLTGESYLPSVRNSGFAVPPGLPALPMNIVGWDSSGPICDIDDAVDALIAYYPSLYNPGTYYLKPSTGSDTNDGLTKATPFATLAKAMKTSAGGSNVVMLEDAVMAPVDLRIADAAQAGDGQIKILDANGFNVTIRISGPDLSAQTWAQDGTYTNCWTTTLTLSGTASLTRVLQTNILDEYGEPTPLKSYASAAALDAAIDGYYYDSAGKVLWVNLGGASVKASRKYLRGLYKDSSGFGRMMVEGSKLGLRGVRMEGVTLQPVDGGGKYPAAAACRCRILFGHGVGVSLTNAGGFYASDCLVYSSAQDTVNGNAPSAVGKGLIQYVRSRFARSGDLRVFADNATYQAASAHGGCDHVAFGCVFELANGQGIADTCSANYSDVTWLVGCRINRQARSSPSLEFGSAATNASRKAYIDSCVSVGPAAADLVIGTNATVYAYNTELPVVTGGTVQSYNPAAPV